METLVWTMRYKTTILHRASRPVPLFIFPLFALQSSSLLASPLLFSLVHSHCFSCATPHSSCLMPNLTPLWHNPSPLVVRLPSSLFVPLPLSASLCFSIYCLCPPRRLIVLARMPGPDNGESISVSFSYSGMCERTVDHEWTLVCLTVRAATGKCAARVDVGLPGTWCGFRPEWTLVCRR